MQTETFALALGADIRPITDEERKLLRKKIRKDEKVNRDTCKIFEMIDVLSLKYGFCWASSKYIAASLAWPEEYIKLGYSQIAQATIYFGF